MANSVSLFMRFRCALIVVIVVYQTQFNHLGSNWAYEFMFFPFWFGFPIIFVVYLLHVCCLDTLFDFQKPKAENLKKWAELLRSDPTMLTKFVSYSTIVLYNSTIICICIIFCFVDIFTFFIFNTFEVLINIFSGLFRNSV